MCRVNQADIFAERSQLQSLPLVGSPWRVVAPLEAEPQSLNRSHS